MVYTMRLVFCGTPQFAVPVLDALIQSRHSVELVLSQPDKAAGRGMNVQVPAVKQLALQYGIRVVQPEKLRNNPDLQQTLQRINPDAIVVVAYGRIIPSWMLQLPRYGNLNLHASLLPKYRGAAPIQWAIASGEVETGVTTMRIDEGLDTGDLLLQDRVPILPDRTSVELFPLLAESGARLMLETLSGLEANSVQARPQDHRLATLAPILQREDGRIDWNRPAQEIYNRWRGFQPWPGAFTSLRGKKLTIHGMRPQENASFNERVPGTLLRDQNRLLIACGDASWLEVLEMQMEGKRRIPAKDFLNGISFMPAERLG